VVRDFQISIDVTAPADDVWPVIADVERWHEWTPSVRSIRRLDGGPLSVGSRAIVRQPKLPPAMWKVTALDPGWGFTWKTGMPGAWVHAHHSVVPLAGGSRATLSLGFEGVLGGVLGHLTRGINARYLALEAAGLKRRSEERAAAGR
jgi:hypothetical protein